MVSRTRATRAWQKSAPEELSPVPERQRTQTVMILFVPYKEVKDKFINLNEFRAPWGPFKIFEPSLRLFYFKVGPSGGHRGYEGMTGK